MPYSCPSPSSSSSDSSEELRRDGSWIDAEEDWPPALAASKKATKTTRRNRSHIEGSDARSRHKRRVRAARYPSLPHNSSSDIGVKVNETRKARHEEQQARKKEFMDKRREYALRSKAAAVVKKEPKEEREDPLA